MNTKKRVNDKNRNSFEFNRKNKIPNNFILWDYNSGDVFWWVCDHPGRNPVSVLSDPDTMPLVDMKITQKPPISFKDGEAFYALVDVIDENHNVRRDVPMGLYISPHYTLDAVMGYIFNNCYKRKRKLSVY
jgi:hypothetical protein